MTNTKKVRRNIIIAISSIIGCFILFFIMKLVIRGGLSIPAGGELCVLIIPLIVYLFIKNWKLFKETFFPKDTTFDDYFNEYFTGKDMVEQHESSEIDYIITW